MTEILPPGWLTTTIGEVTADVQQQQPEPHEEFSYIDISSIDRESKRIRNSQRIRGEKAPSRARKVVATGDVLVSMTRPNLNAVAMVPLELDGQIASTGFEVLRAIELDARWLYYLVRSDKFVSTMSELVQGALYPAVRPADIRSFEIPLAPLKEQIRIADKLDTLLTRMESCRERLARIPLILRRFRQAVLNAAYRGHLTADWRVRNVCEVSGTMLLEQIRAEHREWWEKSQMEAMQKAGKQPKNDNWKQKYKAPEPVEETELAELPNTWAWASGGELVAPGAEIVYGIVQPGPKLDDGVPYVRGTDIEDGRILFDQLMKTSRDIAERYERSSLAGGDVLLGIIRATKVAIVPEELTGGNITQGTARFRPSSVIRTGYLAKALESPPVQSWLHNHYRGIDMPGLNLADVRRVPIPLAPLEEQDEIIRRINILFDIADRLTVRYAAVRDRVDRMTPALISKAFRGELVSPEPKDEPASVLLERIRSTRATQSAKPKGIKKSRKPAMTKITKETVREAISQLPKNTFSFDELRMSFPSDYDALRDAVFALLNEAESMLTQVFDREAKEMRFVRRHK